MLLRQVAALIDFNTWLSYQNHAGICESTQFMRTLLESKVVVGGQGCGSKLCVKMNFTKVQEKRSNPHKRVFRK